MSEAQLKKILQENETLKAHLERMPSTIRSSAACKEYVCILKLLSNRNYIILEINHCFVGFKHIAKKLPSLFYKILVNQIHGIQALVEEFV
jgi:hypothetical protein